MDVWMNMQRVREELVLTVLCKSNASEMHEFRSLLPRLIDESSLESSSEISRRIER